ncbi:hypothetical protein ASPSYDRAFT_134175 [Aspergillus sydowii CBS 593.65]|uniref:Rhodopsin domain-containing protein n=1 Tax=Aspergillus sydowii CBS 593.65 TaxID=1036612 RepID=A0A1L9TCT8_9EURO|nr:uncharacterized protein ASPSYDRAFT_134175 [Aspergillus sydowii CBS 593.65]OJJ57232.1 hypothetical protein ASPSYDRAFT_134175 [Aspergillus sydowii CBS 593.65]
MTFDTSNNGAGFALVRGMWAAIAISAFILILRVFAKVKLRQFRFDDVLMIVSWAMTLAATVLLQMSVNHGFGTDLRKLEYPDLKVVLKAIAIEIPLVTIGTGFARSAFALYIIAILGNKRSYTIALWSVMLLQLAGNIVSGVLPLSICRDARILWNPNIKTTCGDSAAVIKFAYFSSAVNAAADLFLAVFPTVIFWNLNLRLRIKISLIILMSLGILAMIAVIIKSTKYDDIPGITNLGSHGGIELIRWGYAENLIIIITSSVPCIRPLLISSVRKLSSAARSRSYELSGPFSGNKAVQSRTSPNNHSSRRSDNENQAYEEDLPEETDSIERILQDAETAERNRELRRGITKQVEISVMSAHSHSEGSGNRSP